MSIPLSALKLRLSRTNLSCSLGRGDLSKLSHLLAERCRKAAELEPGSAEAHFGLAQYYLNAPPIAGGSLEDAAQEAVVLGQLKSPLGEIVLAQIDAKQGNTEPALQRIAKVVDKYPDLEIAREIHASLSGAEK